MDSNSNLRHTVHTRAMQRAAEMLGGKNALAAYLGVTPVKLGIWMKGAITPPGDVFLLVVDLIFEHEATTLRPGKTDFKHCCDADQANSA